MFEHARHSAELSDAVDGIAAHHQSDVTGTLRLSAPPSISDTLLAPLAGAFQKTYPDVRFHIFVTERFVDHVSEGIDLVFRVGALKDSSLVARKILTYRHQLVASPAYLKKHQPPRTPSDLLTHRLLAFSRWKPNHSWTFLHTGGQDKETIQFQPYLSMNDYTGLAPALVAGAGIGELPPIVQSGLLRDGRLVEVMPQWRFRSVNLSAVHLGNRYIPRPLRLFVEFSAHMAPTLFPSLPTG